MEQTNFTSDQVNQLYRYLNNMGTQQCDSFQLYDLPEAYFTENELICNHCGLIPRQPVLNQKGELYGKFCLTNGKKENIKGIDIRTANELAQLKIFCPVKCEWTGNQIELEKHLLQQCHQMKKKCSNEGCLDILYLFEQALHRNTCLFEKIDCPLKQYANCDEKVQRQSVRQHFQTSQNNHSDGLIMFLSKRKLSKHQNTRYVLSTIADIESKQECPDCLIQLKKTKVGDQKNYEQKKCSKCNQYACSAVSFTCPICVFYVLCYLCDSGINIRCPFCEVQPLVCNQNTSNKNCFLCRQNDRSTIFYSCIDCNHQICHICRSTLVYQ